ncbi:MAG: type I phosphomannose isomerase catalytic subunit [Actinomycetota bacterium]
MRRSRQIAASGVHVVRGVLKDYAWGAVDGLSRWTGESTGGPQAELWFGAHPAGPSPVAHGPDTGRTLADLPEHAGMPLVKILAASTPLSLQVHPDPETAAVGWSRQADQPRETWLYSDDAEKREMLVALTAFDVHAGWRDPEEAADVFARAGAPESLVRTVATADRRDAVRAVLDLDRAECARIEPQLVAAATAAGWSSSAVSALARVAATHPADPGVLVAVLLDHATLAPGEGVAVPAGVIHSYVAGLAVEVMTSSDNVLRLGLTPKPVAVEEALAAVRTDRHPMPLGGFVGEVLDPPGMPFDLVIADQPVRVPTGTHRVVLSLHGETRVTGAGSGDVSLAEGEAAVAAPGEADLVVEPEGSAVVVTGVA